MPHEYYRTKHAKRTADLKPFFALLLIIGLVLVGVLLIGLIGRLCYKDGVKVQDIAQLTQEQRTEVMDRSKEIWQ